jgi:hypothetical protein
MQRYSVRAAYQALTRWVRRGRVPLSARLSVDVPPAPAAPVIERDPLTGIAIGGVREPHVAVPTSTQTGVRPPAAIAAVPSCALFGAGDPWNGDSDPWDGTEFDPSPTPEPELSALYPTHGSYVHQVGDAIERLVRQGFLLKADGAELKREAARSSIPQ